MSRKWVYAFTEGDGKNKKLLGGKGANLCEMTQIGLRVPPGFVITTEACLTYLDDAGGEFPEGMMDQVHAELRRICGGPEVARATVAQLQSRIEVLRRRVHS